MGRVKEASAEVRAQIVVLERQNLSNREVAKITGGSDFCVRKTLQGYSETRSNASRRRSGRPCLNTARSDRIMKHFVQQQFATSCEIRHAMQDHLQRTLVIELFPTFLLNVYVCHLEGQLASPDEQGSEKRQTQLLPEV